MDEEETREQALVEKIGLAESFRRIAELAKNPKVAAVGETGFDYFRFRGDKEETIKIQREYFLKHIQLAKENNLPLIAHCRGDKENPRQAYEEILAILTDPPSLKSYGEARGVIHCFGSDLAMAKEFIKAGFYIGITGIVTFAKKAEELQLVAKEIPLEKILIETDCPYLAPEPHRGGRNEPAYVEFVAKKIAELKGTSVAEVIEQTGKNAEELFKI